MNFNYSRVIALGSAFAFLSSCTVQHDRFTGVGTDVTIQARSITLRSDRLGTSLDITKLDVKTRGKDKACDVKIWVQADTNGDGKIEEKERRLIYSNVGIFTGYKRDAVKLAIQGETESATLVIESRDPKDKSRAPERQLFGIDRDGIHRLTRDKPTSLVIAGGRWNDHFVEATAVSSKEVELAVGDLRKRGGMLARLARRGKPDFLGAVVLLDQKILGVFTGKDIARVRIPQIRGKIGKLRVLTFDRSLRLCADFALDGIRTQ